MVMMIITPRSLPPVQLTSIFIINQSGFCLHSVKMPIMIFLNCLFCMSNSSNSEDTELTVIRKGEIYTNIMCGTLIDG